MSRPRAVPLPDALVEEAKRRTDLAALIQGDGVALRRSGRAFVGRCPFHADRTPSFFVRPERGTFRCYGCGESGTAFDWLMQRDGVGFRAAVLALAERAGLDLPEGAGAPGRRRRRIPLAPVVVSWEAEAEAARRRAFMSDRARDLWHTAAPLAGTQGEAYLRARGLRPPSGGWPASLRFLPAVPYRWRDRQDKSRGLGTWPALVCAIQAPPDPGRVAGTPVRAVQLIYLDAAGAPAKAAIEAPEPDADGVIARLPVKITLGAIAGGALRFGAAGPHLVVAEGPETGLTLHAALSLPVWCALSLTNISGGGRGRGRKRGPTDTRRDGLPPNAAFLPSRRPDPDRPGIVLPPVPLAATVTIAEDADSVDPAAADALYARASARWVAEGRTVRRMRPTDGGDFNDMVKEAAA